MLQPSFTRQFFSCTLGWYKVGSLPWGGPFIQLAFASPGLDQVLFGILVRYAAMASLDLGLCFLPQDVRPWGNEFLFYIMGLGVQVGQRVCEEKQNDATLSQNPSPSLPACRRGLSRALAPALALPSRTTVPSGVLHLLRSCLSTTLRMSCAGVHCPGWGLATRVVPDSQHLHLSPLHYCTPSLRPEP